MNLVMFGRCAQMWKRAICSLLIIFSSFLTFLHCFCSLLSLLLVGSDRGDVLFQYNTGAIKIWVKLSTARTGQTSRAASEDRAKLVVSACFQSKQSEQAAGSSCIITIQMWRLSIFSSYFQRETKFLSKCPTMALSAHSWYSSHKEM